MTLEHFRKIEKLQNLGLKLFEYCSFRKIYENVLEYRSDSKFFRWSNSTYSSICLKKSSNFLLYYIFNIILTIYLDYSPEGQIKLMSEIQTRQGRTSEPERTIEGHL